jgi:hypothetical protein
MDAATGKIVAAALTANDVDDASQTSALLDQVDGSVVSFTGDGAYDQDTVYRAVMQRNPAAGGRCPATLHGGAERDGRDRSNTA